MIYNERPWLKFYDEDVEPDLTSQNATCVDLLEKGFSEHAEKNAVHFMGKTLTFSELYLYSCKFSAFLVDNGCSLGDVVGLNMPNIPQYLIAIAGTLRAGCIVSGVSPLMAPKEMIHQLNDSGAKVLVSLDTIYEEKVIKIQDDVPDLSHVVVTSMEEIFSLPDNTREKPKPIQGKTILTFRNILDKYLTKPPKQTIEVDDTCFIQYTGGTTGLPKGAELSQNGFATNVLQFKQWHDVDPGNETMLSGFPFFHSAGLLFGVIGMSMGCTQILVPNPRDTSHICKEFAIYKPTIMANVPSLYQMLFQNSAFEKLDFSQLKVCISGAAPFPVESLKTFEKLVGKGKVNEGLGITEGSVLLMQNPRKGPNKIGTVGIPIQSTRVKLMDLNDGIKEVPIGEGGEIVVSAPQLFTGYHNNPKESAHALRTFQGKKWFYTGDVARMDEDGYFTIVDRAKDMINVSGYKVFSREVEEILTEHPAVDSCAIVGMPDPDRPGSELVKALIQLSKNYQNKERVELKLNILEFFRENMSPYKKPKIIKFVDQLPLTAVGKVDKKALR